MAVEIRELIIKATVVNDNDKQAGGNITPADKAQLVQECVREVMKIIAKSKNR